MEEDVTCDVCGMNEPMGVASSSLGPFSVSFCSECLGRRAEPEWAFGATLEMTEGNVADWVKNLNTFKDGSYISWEEWLSQQEAA